MTHKDIFTEIYDKKIWGDGSGGGSTPENTVEYRAFLQRFLKEYNIRSVIDYGCGDWGFSHMINWSGVLYLGYDCVESVIERNRKLYTRPNIEFTSELSALMGLNYELLIVKDVMQHWSDYSIDAFLSGARPRCKYVLITNTQAQEPQEDIQTGDCRPLSAKFPPLSKYNPKILAEIQTTIKSEVSLITSERS